MVAQIQLSRATSWENMPLGMCKQVRLKAGCSATEAAPRLAAVNSSDYTI